LQIICFHNVLDEALDAFDRSAPRITVASFVRQMEYLAQSFRIVPLQEAVQIWRSGEPTANLAVITFDDAYYGVYAHALPILRRIGVPATVFAVTAHVEAGGRIAFEHDETEIAFRLARTARIDAEFLGLGELELESESDRISAMKAVKKILKVTPARDLSGARALLFERLGVTAEECQEYAGTRAKFRQMGWNELRELQREGWEVGSHTRTHKAVGQLEPLQRREELDGSAEDLQRNLGLVSMSFAYPYGETSHIGEAAPEAVRGAGYTCAVTMVPGQNDSRTSPFLLHRLEFARLVYETTFQVPASTR
jgi:peptidoglycan/xylan/chitin deacetylase (PgdA/CDA1 family)